jgi:hypothetical protein
MAVLQPVYERFIEGFDTVDLIAGKTFWTSCAVPIAIEAAVVKITKHLSVSTNQTQTLRARHGLCSLFNIELGEDVLHVRLHGLGNDR